MIKRWVPIESVIDNYLDEVDSFENGESKLHALGRMSKRYAYGLFSRTSGALYTAIDEGVIKNNMIELPEGYCKAGPLKVDGQNVSLTMQQFLRSGKVVKSVDSVYKAAIVGEFIQFNVIGGDTQGLNGKPYIFEYKTVPLIDDVLYVPEQFEDAIHARLAFNLMKRRIELNGRGEGLLRTYKQLSTEAENDAIMDVDFPSWEELLEIGRIWESKIPLRLERGASNNFTEN